MQKIIVDIPEKYCNILRDTYYDVESYKIIMTELAKASKNEDFDKAILEDFKNHYKNALIAHEEAKAIFEIEFVREEYPTVTAWNVTFGDKKVSITYS